MSDEKEPDNDSFDIELDYSAIIEGTDIVDEPKLGSVTTEEILDGFIQSEEKVSKYEKGRKYYYRLKNWTVITIIVGYLIGVVLFATSQTGGIRETIGTTIFGISLLLAIVIFILQHIFRNRAEKQNITSEEATYHRLSKSIDSYLDENRNMDAVRKNLMAAKRLLEQGQNNAFDTEFSGKLIRYLDTVSETDSNEELEKTFPVISNSVIRHLSIIYIDESEELLYPYLETESASKGISTRDLIISYFTDMFDKQIVRVSAPFILSTPLIVAIYLYIDETVAQFVLLSVIAISQIYYNLSYS